MELAPTPSHIYGPTWQRWEDGSWYLPEYTLGWGVLRWLWHYCRQPGGQRAGKNFKPTMEQARFLLWWYAVDESGRFVYRSGLLRRMKGWGKDPLAAAMSLVELCGPTVFSHWDLDGQPVGTTHAAPWIQVAAVSHDQTRNTFTLFPAMASKELRQEFGLEVHKTIIYARDGGLIEGVTSSPLALEGKRPTLVIMNEIQWWLENNQGYEMYNVIEGNITKSAGGQARYLAIFNAHVPGQDSVAEMLHDNYHLVESGQAIDTGLLYDALEAPADTPVSDIPSIHDDPEGHQAGVAKLREGIDIARGDSVWLDLDTIINAVLDINNPVSESRRKYLNQINATEDSWIAPTEWDSVQSDVTLQPKDKITLGFDGSKSQDTTAIVACRVEDGALFLIKLWLPEHYGGEVPRDDVDATVHSMFEKYEVVGFRADVAEFEAYVDQWGQQYKKKIQVKAAPNAPIAFDMRGYKKQFALDCERFLDAVYEGELTHDGNKLLKNHITNAHRNPTNYDAISIRKASKDSSRKIDAAVCSVLAFGSRHDYLMSKKNRSKKARVYG